MEERKSMIENDEWIKTPFAYTKIVGGLSLFQQNVLILVSDKLQDYIKQFLDDKRYKNPDRPKPIYTMEQKNEALTVRVALKDLGVADTHYSAVLQPVLKKNENVVKTMVLPDLRRLEMRVSYLEKDENTGKQVTVSKWQPIFKSIATPMDSYNKNGFQFDVRNGWVEFVINDLVADYLLDMSEGYIEHLKMLAKISKKKYTPSFYFLLKSQGSPHYSTKLEDLKTYMGVLKLNKEDMTVKDSYPRYSRFKQCVIEPAMADMKRLADEGLSDIWFTYKEIRPRGLKTGNPERIDFDIFRSDMGAKRLEHKDKNKAKYGKERKEPIMQDLFANVSAVEYKIQTEVGQGTDKWQEFLSRIIDDNQKTLLSRLSFVGMKNERFCIKCSDDDCGQLRASGLERVAQEYFGCVGSFAPVFYRG